MLQRLLFLVFVAFAGLGLRSAALEGEIVEAHDAGDDGCCPCEEDGAPDDGCCASAQCACFPGAAVATTARSGPVHPVRAAQAPAAWTLGAEQRARERSTAPPTRPPIG